MGPSAFRAAGLGDQIAALGYVVVDRGDLPAPIPETKKPLNAKKKYAREIGKVCQKLYEVCLKSLDENALPLVLGGDHSLAAGSVAASATWLRKTHQKPVGLIWVDAHGTVLVGIRNLDEQEKQQIRAAGVHVFTMKDIDRDGIAQVAERALALASKGTGGVHVSFDLDACDPMIAPGVGTPVKGGFDYREAHMIMEMFADSRSLVALDLVEVNPTLDIRNQTAEFGSELALSALGKNIL
jgi:arginase